MAIRCGARRTLASGQHWSAPGHAGHWLTGESGHSLTDRSSPPAWCAPSRQMAKLPYQIRAFQASTDSAAVGHNLYSTLQRQTAVTAHLKSKQLLLFACAPDNSSTRANSSNCLLWNKQLLLFTLVLQYPHLTPLVQRQTAVTAYFSSKQLLLFVFALMHSST